MLSVKIYHRLSPKTCLILLSLIFFQKIEAQDKYDYTWFLGYKWGGGGMKLEFLEDSIRQTECEMTINNIRSISEICDSTGNLLFYTNGCSISHLDGTVMTNGEGLNPGVRSDEWCIEDEVGYKGFQSMVALPWPGRPGHYALIHQGQERKIYFEIPPFFVHDYIDKLYLTHIDMNLEDGRGAVVSKNEIILQDSMTDNVSVVRHGNGRDWWIVVPKQNSNTFFTTLLTPEGPRPVTVQSIGEKNGMYERGDIVKFTPDGTKYLRTNYNTGIDIIDFDRCSGLFTCARRIPFPVVYDYYSVSAVGISPSSRYMYISTYTELYQYDLWANDIAASKVLVGEYSSMNQFATFFQQQLAPDGKIYMCATNSIKSLHVIHDPELPGKACNFEQEGLKLLHDNAVCLPNFPNFRLYDLPASPCDTLGIDSPQAQNRVVWSPSDRLRIYPNPATETARVTLPPGCLRGEALYVYTVSGVLLREVPITAADRYIDIDCSNMPAAMYFVVMSKGCSERPWTAKLVVLH